MESSIGPFEVIGNLGSGPRGTVYRARHTTQGRVVAIKQLTATLAAGSPEFTRLWNEVARLRAVVSNHVATTHSVEIFDGRPVIEMESLGESMEKVTTGRPLVLRDAMRVIHDVLAGLKVLHDAGIIHDNLKPSNVLQDTTTGSWKISDGGTTAIETQTSPTLLAASVLYVAPETLLQHSRPSLRSDLYCVGMLGLEAMLGSDRLREAFPQVANISSPSRWLAWLADPAQKAVPLRQLRPEAPEDISEFISTLLSKDPQARFASALEATVELEAILDALAAAPADVMTQTAVNEAPTISELAPSQAESTAWLIVTGPEGFNQRIDLSNRTYRIGRDRQNDIVLPDDSKTVSRIHAELRREGNHYTVIDLDSQNGLLVNGRRKTSVQLQPGAAVKVGAFTLIFSPPVSGGGTTVNLAHTAPGTPAARNAAPKPAAPSAAMEAVKAAMSAVSAIVLAWWPPKNAQEWAAVIAVPAAAVAIVTWLALRGPSTPQPGPIDVVVTNTPLAPPPPQPSVPTASDQSLNHIRQLLDEKKYELAQREIDTLLGRNPQDAEALKLQEEAQAGLASLTPTPAAPLPPSAVRKGTPKTPVISSTPTTTLTPVIPKIPTEAEKLKQAQEERDFSRAHQLLVEIHQSKPGHPGLVGAALQIGKAAERANDLRTASQLFKLAHDIAPASADALSLTKEGEQAFRDASDDANYPQHKERAVEGLRKAIRYLPDGHQSKKAAQDTLARITK